MKQDEEMSDSEMWRLHRQASQEKRASNRENSTALLRESGVEFDVKNGGAHLIVESDKGKIDFWPGTGKWRARNGKEGRGVRRLLAYIFKDKPVATGKPAEPEKHRGMEVTYVIVDEKPPWD